ncbi:MAG: 1-deoxy-D-xylulose-5-phosphate synthase [Planctomycetes bacterium SM23_65]|nr:MAG: 1-deoxy-D-xylulose-5-phosphate synthase [Planctomycetes bacterium SM23_65]
MGKLLDDIESPEDLKKLAPAQLPELAEEIRRLIREVVERNGGHLASNLGVVELTIALHYLYDFSTDRLIWDVGHQCYTHKLLTGRREQFQSLRLIDGLSGFPGRDESPYDPFTAGHSGTSISTALGLLMGLERTRELLEHPPEVEPRVVAVTGDASIATGVAFEGLNHTGDLVKRLLVILNDNRMAISGTVGALGKYLNRIRTSSRYNVIKREVRHFIDSVPALGPRMEHAVERLKDLIRHSVVRGGIFEELGFRYFGPIDGHSFDELLTVLGEIHKLRLDQPILLHVITQKGRGHDGACEDPTRFHGVAPAIAVNGKISEETPVAGKPSYTKVFSRVIGDLAWANPELCAITAAMPDGTGLIDFGKSFPERLYDVGICEQHAVALAGGLAAAGLRPVVTVYSTFLQRAYDQIFHDVCLQGLPVIFAIDRAGLVGSDGPTHHGVFDIAYLRHLPGMVLMAPSDGRELERMFRFAMTLEVPCAIRYPRAPVPEEAVSSDEPVALGKSVQLAEGDGGTLLAYGSMVEVALEVPKKLASEGIELCVIDARFAKPLDEETILREVGRAPFVLTLEEGCVVGGFGSAVLELGASRGVDVRKVHLAGIPDRFIEHGPRSELLRRVGLHADGLAKRAREIHQDFVRTRGS